MCSELMWCAVDALLFRAPMWWAEWLMWACIAPTTGADVLTTATTIPTGFIPDFMAGGGIRGELQWLGESGHGAGADRPGGDSMRAGGIRIPSMPLRTTG